MMFEKGPSSEYFLEVCQGWQNWQRKELVGDRPGVCGCAGSRHSCHGVF